MAMDYDYDIALAQSRNKNIIWVSPSEGMCGYIEGWSALNTSKHLDVVWAFMNFHLDPKNYASFVNATALPTWSPPRPRTSRNRSPITRASDTTRRR